MRNDVHDTAEAHLTGQMKGQTCDRWGTRPWEVPVRKTNGSNHNPCGHECSPAALEMVDNRAANHAIDHGEIQVCVYHTRNKQPADRSVQPSIYRTGNE
jgi:hypothetical protein